MFGWIKMKKLPFVLVAGLLSMMPVVAFAATQFIKISKKIIKYAWNKMA